MIRFRSSSPQFRAALVGSLLFCCLTPLVQAQSSSGTEAVEEGRARYGLDSDDNAGATSTTTTTTTTRTRRRSTPRSYDTGRSYDSSTESIVQRARSRYAADAASAEDHISLGDSATIRKDYDLASREYRAAVDALPPAPATADRRKVAVKKFFDATLMLANQRITEGRYVDAETSVKVILRPEYDPGYKPAIRQLEAPGRPRVLQPDGHARSSSTASSRSKTCCSRRRAITTAPRYDLAFKRYEQILVLDPYNNAARKGEERVDLRTRHHGDPLQLRRNPRPSAQGRGPRLGHARAPAGPGRGPPQRGGNRQRDDVGTAAINRKLAAHHHPQHRVPLDDDQRRHRISAPGKPPARHRPDPDARGVNIFLKLPGAGGARPPRRCPGCRTAAIPGLPPGRRDRWPRGAPAPRPPANTRITLTLGRIPLLEALKYVAQQAGLKVKVEPYAVSIVPVSEQTDVLVTADFRVPPNFISNSTTAAGSAAARSIRPRPRPAAAAAAAGPT